MSLNFIKLTRRDPAQPILVNFDLIESVVEVQGGCDLHLVGTVEDYYAVSESLDEIHARIHEFRVWEKVPYELLPRG